MNGWLSRRVVGFAHQGGALEGPAGTVETMRLARRNGTAALEFDLHLTGDKRLVVHHDPVIGKARIAATDLGELRRAMPDLATLEEVLVAFPGVPLTVEIKARAAAEPAARVLAGEPGDRPLIVTAFAPTTITAAKRAAARLDTAPGWPTNLGFWLLSRVLPAPPIGRKHVALQVALRLDQVKFVKSIPVLRRLRVADRRLVAAAHRRSLAVHVWTLNDEASIRAALEAGADGIFTDRPTVLTGALDAAGLRWKGP